MPALHPRVPPFARLAAIVAITTLVALTVAACSSTGGGTAAPESAPPAGGEPGSAETGTTPTQAPASPASGSCADELPEGSPAQIACAWIARSDPAVCAQMSDSLLEEIFGAGGTDGIESCRARLESVASPGDPSLVTFTTLSSSGRETVLQFEDAARSQEITYEVTLRMEGERWRLETARQVRVAHGGGAPGGDEGPPPDTATVQAIKDLALRWYRDLDPSVCDSMTDAFVELGWDASGEAGRRLCREAIAEAEPLDNVKARTPVVRDDTASVVVVYTQGGERLYDRLGLVRQGGAWLIDAVKATGFVP